MPTTTNTTTSSSSVTEDQTVDQPDRDSMVTPKLDDSDYKSDQDSHHQPETETGSRQNQKSKTVVTATPSSAESSDAIDAQQAPSSSEIKPEEPSSTTSPLPSATSSSMSSVSGGSAPASSAVPTSSSDLGGPPELKPAEQKPEISETNSNLAENAPIQSKDNSDQNKQSETLNKSDSKTDSATIGKEADPQKPPVPPGGLQLPPGATGMLWNIFELRPQETLVPVCVQDF